MTPDGKRDSRMTSAYWVLWAALLPLAATRPIVQERESRSLPAGWTEEMFQTAHRRYRNYTDDMLVATKVSRTRPSGIWKTVWKALVMGEPPQEWDLSVQGLLAEIGASDHPTLRMMARQALRLDVQEETEEAEQLALFTSYCRHCHGEICQHLCLPQAEDLVGIRGPAYAWKHEIDPKYNLPQERKRSATTWARVSGGPGNITIRLDSEGEDGTNFTVPQIHPGFHSFNPTKEARTYGSVDDHLAGDPPQDTEPVYNHHDDAQAAIIHHASDLGYSSSRTFEAYDCSQPFDLKTVTTRTEDDCRRSTSPLPERGCQVLAVTASHSSPPLCEEMQNDQKQTTLVLRPLRPSDGGHPGHLL